jgi:hypothetical protein
MDHPIIVDNIKVSKRMLYQLANKQSGHSLSMVFTQKVNHLMEVKAQKSDEHILRIANGNMFSTILKTKTNDQHVSNDPLLLDRPFRLLKKNCLVAKNQYLNRVNFSVELDSFYFSVTCRHFLMTVVFILALVDFIF